jgi:hypothetical protein
MRAWSFAELHTSSQGNTQGISRLTRRIRRSRQRFPCADSAALYRPRPRVRWLLFSLFFRSSSWHEEKQRKHHPFHGDAMLPVLTSDNADCGDGDGDGGGDGGGDRYWLARREKAFDPKERTCPRFLVFIESNI